MISFAVTARDGAARTGVLITPHGEVRTPVFMPVGTQAAVKALAPEDTRSAGAEIVLANTYHLVLRPGVDLIERFGGLHRFMAWDGPILTDSGGFQVFSLGHLRTLTDDSVTFRSHIDGSEHTLTPESAVEAQERLGSDIAMVLDHCPAYGDDEAAVRESMERTHRWAERCLKARRRKDQALFGIVQGGWSAELRRESAALITSLDFPGVAIGGVSVGEPKEAAYRVVEQTAPHLPESKPRYLMGVGAPDDLIECIARGIDMFDCTLPTRIARNGGLFTREGRINLRGARYREQEGPIEGRLRLLHLRHVLDGLPPPLDAGGGDPLSPPGHGPQPAVRAAAGRRSARGDRRGAVRRLRRRLLRSLPADGRGDASGAEGEVACGPTRVGRARERRLISRRRRRGRC